VDGVEAVVHLRRIDDRWRPQAIVQLAVAGDRIAHVRDYIHVEYLLASSTVTHAA